MAIAITDFYPHWLDTFC